MKKNNEISEMIADLENLESVNEKVTSLLNENLTWLKTDGVDADNVAIIDGKLYDIDVDIAMSRWKIFLHFTRVSPFDGMKFTIIIFKADERFKVTHDSNTENIPEKVMDVFHLIKEEIDDDPTEKEE